MPARFAFHLPVFASCGPVGAVGSSCGLLVRLPQHRNLCPPYAGLSAGHPRLDELMTLSLLEILLQVLNFFLARHG